MTIALKPIRSFVKRERNKPKQQALANKLWPQYGLDPTQLLNIAHTFTSPNRSITLEIGFGTGDSLFRQAQTHLDQHYIGIEVYHTGVVALLSQLDSQPLSNIRIFEGDAISIVSTCLPDNSLDAVQILFPDPWPKTKHHKRRLVQPPFIQQIKTKLKIGGRLYLATDWAHYAHHMLHVLETIPGLQNTAGVHQFCERPVFLPQTKFEQRGLDLGHSTFFLCFTRWA